MEKKVAAFFDIDGTIYRNSLLVGIFNKLLKADLIDNSEWDNDLKHRFYNWLNRSGSYDDYILTLADIYKKSVVGLHKDVIERLSKKIIEEESKKTYKFTRERIEFHKKNGHLLIAISGSPDVLVKDFANFHEFDDFVATSFVCDESGCYTDEIIPMWGKNHKELAMDMFIEKYNIDASLSYSYGDTVGDITMFKKIGNPTAINPSKSLVDSIYNDEELLNKINLIVERKDVVYNITKNSIE